MQLLETGLVYAAFLLYHLLATGILPAASIHNLYVHYSTFVFLACYSTGYSGEFAKTADVSFLPYVLRSRFSIYGATFKVLPREIHYYYYSNRYFFYHILDLTSFVAGDLGGAVVSATLRVLRSFSRFDFFSSRSIGVLGALHRDT